MKPRKEVIEDVLNAFLGIDGQEEGVSAVLDDDEIDLLSTAIDEALKG